MNPLLLLLKFYKQTCGLSKVFRGFSIETSLRHFLNRATKDPPKLFSILGSIIVPLFKESCSGYDVWLLLLGHSKRYPWPWTPLKCPLSEKNLIFYFAESKYFHEVPRSSGLAEHNFQVIHPFQFFIVLSLQKGLKGHPSGYENKTKINKIKINKWQ